MTRGEPLRDPELARLLRDAGLSKSLSPEALWLLRGRIAAAATPLLDELVPSRTVWDYAEGWSSMLLPLGALAALAASLCLFSLTGSREPRAGRGEPRDAPGDTPRVALLGVATSHMSSQRLVDLLVSNDDAVSSSSRSASRAGR